MISSHCLFLIFEIDCKTMGDVDAWEELKDKDGKTFYFNKFTKESAWVKPNFENPWTEMQDEDGDTYYYNTITKQTQWEDPKTMEPEQHDDENDDMESMEQSDSDIEMQEKKEVLTPNEQFTKLLEQYNIDDTWTYESTIRKIYNDPMFKSLPTASERKQAFFTYISEHRQVMRERRDKEFASLFDEIKPKLEELLKSGSLTTGMSFLEFSIVFKESKISQTMVDKEYTERAWRESLNYLKIIEDKFRQELKKKAYKLLDANQTLQVTIDLKWSDFEAKVKGHPIWTDELRQLPDVDLLDYFEAKIRKSEADFNSNRQRESINANKQASAARNDFRKDLLILKHNGQLNAKSKWTELYPVISKLPSYERVINAPGSTPLELFWDVVEDEFDIYAIDKKNLINFFNQARIHLNFKDFDEFRNAITSSHARIKNIPSTNLQLIYESINK